jgi:DNA-binding protein HU-beta
MTKAELIAKIAEDTGITKVAANTALESFIGAVEKTLKKGDKLTLTGFGTFSVAKRAARKGRNPFTGETIKIKAKKVARVSFYRKLSKTIESLETIINFISYEVYRGKRRTDTSVGKPGL